MNQRLLVGEVVNGDRPELERLRSTVDRLTRERDALREENDELQSRLRESDAPIVAIRAKLEPFYRLLQALWGDIEQVAPEPTAAASNAAPQSSPIWDSWKARLPGAPAKIIDALLLHRDASVEQLVVLTGISRKPTIYDAVHRMNKAGIINKNGGRFSLKV